MGATLRDQPGRALTEADIASAGDLRYNRGRGNYIVNGAMMVSQENGTTAGTASGYYPVDEWQVIYGNAGAVSVAQVANVTPAGSPNRLRVTVTTADAAVAAGDYSLISTRLEGLRVADLQLGTASAKTFTMRFGVKAPAGTYGIVFRNSAANRTYLAEFTISGGEANTDVVKSVILTGDTTGTWLKDTGVGLAIYIALMAGSTYQGTPNVWSAAGIHGSSSQFNFMGTINNVFELFDVSLTQGTVAPTFSVPDYADELDRCMRYYETVGGLEAGKPMAVGYIYNTSTAFATVFFKATKRATPTFTARGVAADYSVYRAGANNAIDNLPSMDAATSEQAHVRHVHTTGPFTAGQGVQFYAVTTTARYAFNSRL